MYTCVICLYSKLQWFAFYIVCLIQEIILGILVWNAVYIYIYIYNYIYFTYIYIYITKQTCIHIPVKCMNSWHCAVICMLTRRKQFSTRHTRLPQIQIL